MVQSLADVHLQKEAVVPKDQYIDFEAVKAANPIEEVAKRLGLTLQKSGKQLRGPCPSGEGGERALAITPAKNLWYSFGKNEGGDVLALVQLVQGGTAQDAARFLSNTEPPEKTDTSSKAEGAERGFRPLEYLEPDHAAVEAIGLDPEDAKRLGMGYAPRGILRGTVAVPIRLEDGTLVGYIGVTEAVLPPGFSL